ncbi:MAG: GWxTD domain-containing protein [Cyclobacteriaceae bacterium]
MRKQEMAILIFAFFSFFQSFGLDLSKFNWSYQYQTQVPVEIAHRVVAIEDDIVVFFKIDVSAINQCNYAFLLQDKYASIPHDTLTNSQLDTLSISQNQGYFKLTLPQTNQSLLIISISDPSENLYFLEDIKVSSPVGFPSLYPVDADGLPIFSAYINQEKTLIKGAQSIHAYEYSDNFKSADPPMGIMKTLSPNLEIDSSFFFDGQPSMFKDYKFYLLQKDTLDQNGLTMLKCPAYYPKYKALSELIDPLTYITTSAEIKSLQKSYSKKDFEVFWINTYGTKFRAKNAIKVFYDRVEEVNELFTDYKQGWKTDRGLIFMIFGAPPKVTRDERLETWTYNNGVEFEFIRISTLFAPTMYSLRRNRKYEKLWYNQVGEIRKGL